MRQTVSYKVYVPISARMWMCVGTFVTPQDAETRANEEEGLAVVRKVTTEVVYRNEWARP